jgi:hypothetical protein
MREPCGECYIQPGETCDICGVHRERPVDGWRYRWKIDGVFTSWQVVGRVPDGAETFTGFEKQPLFTEPDL